MTYAQQRLLDAAKWTKRVLQARINGEYLSPNEDIESGRELAAAIRDVEAEEVDTRQFAAAAGDPRRA
jgi:hypothetical protein